MTDERRERYAAAIGNALGGPGGEPVSPRCRNVQDSAAAVMAVANRERQAERVALCKYVDALRSVHDAEIERLRAELADAHREIETLECMFYEQG